MVKERKINKGAIKEGNKILKDHIKDSSKSGSLVLPEDSVVKNIYVKKGKLSNSEAWKHTAKHLEKLKVELEDGGKLGIFGVGHERIKRANRNAKEFLQKEYVASVRAGKEKGYAIGKHVLGGKHLERQLVTVVSILSLGIGFLFASPSITGRAIGGTSILDLSIIGIAFFILGLVGLLLCVKKSN